MNSDSILGLVAGAFTTVAFVPQLRKAWVSRSTKDISLAMFLIFTTGVLLWLVYGIMRQDLPIILWNAVTFVLTCIILFLKLKHK